VPPDTIRPLVIDTIEVIDQRAYIELLEKTNQQLSFWWTPWSVMLAFLSVLVGGGAILAAVLLFRQSRENREMVLEVVEEQLEVLARFVEEKNALVDLRLSEIRQEMDNASGEHLQKLQSDYDSWKRKLVTRPPREPGFFRVGDTKREHPFLATRRSGSPAKAAPSGSRCPNCGTHWDLDEPIRSGDHLECPRCAAEFPLR